MGSTSERIVLEADDKTAAAFRQIMKNASKLSDEGKKIGRSFGALKGIMGGLSLGFAVREIGQVVTTVDSMAKAAKVAGVLPETLQEIRFAMGQLADIADSEVDGALQNFNTRLGQAIELGGPAKDSFQELGVSILDASGKIRTTDAVLTDALEALANVESGSIRAAKASELFGKSTGPILAQALEEGIISMNELRQLSQDTGLVLSNELVKGAEEAADKIDIMKRSLGTEFQTAVLENTDAIMAMADVVMDLGNAFGFVAKQTSRSAKGVADWTWGLFSGVSVEDMEKAGERAGATIKKVEGQWFMLKNNTKKPPAKDNQTNRPSSVPDYVSEKTGRKTKEFDPEGDFLSAIEDQQFKNLIASYEKAEAEAIESAEKIREAQQKMLDEGKALFESTRTPLEMYNAELKHLNELLQQNAIDHDTYSRAIDTARQSLNDAQTQAKLTNDSIRDIGLTFTSAAEEAVFSGSKITDVIKGLAEDLAKMAFRKALLEPLLGAFSGMIGDFGMSAAGSTVTGLGGEVLGTIPGYRAAGGPVSRGNPYIVGEQGPELFVPGGSGNIVSNNDLTGTNVTVNVINRGTPAEVQSSKQSKGPGGNTVIDVIIKDSLARQQQDGSLPAFMKGNYGVNRRPIQRG